jgi:uncharacterized protein YjbI with pentapeptide repeats
MLYYRTVKLNEKSSFFPNMNWRFNIIIIGILFGGSYTFAQANGTSNRRKKKTIATQFQPSEIKNNFPLFDRITSRSSIVHPTPVSLWSSTLSEVTNYYNYHFLDSISFNRVDFKQNFDFSLSSCFSAANFHQCYFFKAANFNWASFHQRFTFSRNTVFQCASYTNTQFAASTDFYHSHFHSTADFYRATFHGEANFVNSIFKKNAIFTFTTFEKSANFKNVEFSSDCFFNNTSLQSEIDFSGAKFNEKLDFSRSIISGSLIFKNSTLPHYLDLSNLTHIASIIDLTEVKINENFQTCFLHLVNTDISKLKFRYHNFHLWFPKNCPYEVKCNVYESLLTSLKNKGFKKSFEKLDIEYKKLKYGENKQYVKNYVQENWWNYGYNKEYIFIWIFWFTSILTLVNTVFLSQLMGRIYVMDFLDYQKVLDRNKLNHPLLSFFMNLPTGFLYTVVLLIGGAFGMKFNSSQIKFPGFLGLTYIISIGLLGISCSAFILNLIFSF